MKLSLRELCSTGSLPRTINAACQVRKHRRKTKMKALCTARFETTIMLQNVFLMLKFMIPFLLLPGCERYNVGEATANHPLKQQMLFVLRSLCHLHHLHTCHTSWHWLQYVIQGSVFPPCCLVQETMQLSYKLVWSCCYLWG